MSTHLNPHTILDDHRVNKDFIAWRWKNRVPFSVKDCITSDLSDYEEIEKKGGININCKFYKPIAIKHASIFHHHCPEWELRMREELTAKEVNIRYTMKKFFIGKEGPFQNENRK